MQAALPGGSPSATPALQERDWPTLGRPWVLVLCGWVWAGPCGEGLACGLRGVFPVCAGGAPQEERRDAREHLPLSGRVLPW